MPDIALDPVHVPARLATPDDVVRLVPPAGWHESDLEGHLTSSHAVAGARSAEVVSYLAGAPRDRFAAFAPDFAIELARDLVASATNARRPDLLRGGKKLIGKRRQTEQAKIAAALGKLGVGWKPGKRKPGATLTATFSTDKPGDRAAAGDTIAITGVVTNTGTAAAHQVRARATSEDDVVDGVELVFGRIAPGASKRVTVHVAIPAGAESHLAVATWDVAAQHTTPVTAAPLRLSIDGQPRPQYAYTYALIEDPTAKGDGVIRPGDRFVLRVKVTNTGPGRGPATVVTLHSASRTGLAIDGGRIDLAAVAPGETRDVDLGFRIRPELAQAEVVVELAVFDEVLATGVSDKLTFPIGGGTAVAASVTPPQLVVPEGPLETTDSDLGVHRLGGGRRPGRGRVRPGHQQGGQDRGQEGALRVEPRRRARPQARLRRRDPAVAGQQPDHDRRARERRGPRAAHGPGLSRGRGALITAARAASDTRLPRTRRRRDR